MHKLQQKHQQLNGTQPSELCVMATGGGAFKYYDEIKKTLGVEVLREDEMECLIIGILARSVWKIHTISLTYPFKVSTSSSPRSPPRFSRTPITRQWLSYLREPTYTHTYS